MKKILIQANNLDTVIDVFMYVYLHPDCKKQDIADYCGFSLRQVDYYTNACKYLDLMDEDWGKTSLAEDIFENSKSRISERIYERIIGDEIIGKIFAKVFMFPETYPSEYAEEVVKDYFPDYSESVVQRRADNMIKWCKSIINKRIKINKT